MGVRDRHRHVKRLSEAFREVRITFAWSVHELTVTTSMEAICSLALVSLTTANNYMTAALMKTSSEEKCLHITDRAFHQPVNGGTQGKILNAGGGNKICLPLKVIARFYESINKTRKALSYARKGSKTI